MDASLIGCGFLLIPVGQTYIVNGRSCMHNALHMVGRVGQGNERTNGNMEWALEVSVRTSHAKRSGDVSLSGPVGLAAASLVVNVITVAARPRPAVLEKRVRRETPGPAKPGCKRGTERFF